MTQHTQPVVVAQHQQQQQQQPPPPQQQQQTTNINNNNNNNTTSTSNSANINNQTQTLAVQQQQHNNNNNYQQQQQQQQQLQQQQQNVAAYNSQQQLHSSNLYVPTHGMPPSHPHHPHSHHPHHQQGATMYPTMIPAQIPSNVYVNNVTANVNLHGWAHTVPHGAWVHPGGTPHYIHGDMSPEQGVPVIQQMGPMPVSMPPGNALSGPLMNQNPAGGSRGSRRGRGRGGSSGSRRNDYNNMHRHPPPEGSPVPQQSVQQTNQQDMLQQQQQQQQQQHHHQQQQLQSTDGQQQMMTSMPPTYVQHPQYASHAPQYPYGYPTYFAPQQHMIHPSQSAAAQQATGAPLYISTMPVFNGQPMYNYGYFIPPVMNPNDYPYMSGEEVGPEGDDRQSAVDEGGPMMWHQQQMYAEDYSMNPGDMHSLSADDMNQNPSSMGSAADTPGMLSPNYAPIYDPQLHEQMQQHMGVMHLYDDPHMGQMQVMHSQPGLPQMDDDISECGSQPSVPIQIVSPGAIIAAPTMPMPPPSNEQMIHQQHPPHLMPVVSGGAILPPIEPTITPTTTAQHQQLQQQQQQHSGDTIIECVIQNYEQVPGVLQPGESVTSLNEQENLQQSTDNLAIDFQLAQHQPQLQPQMQPQNVCVETMVQTENYSTCIGNNSSNNKILMTDVQELQENVPNVISTNVEVAIETTTVINSVANKQPQQPIYQETQQQNVAPPQTINQSVNQQQQQLQHQPIQIQQQQATIIQQQPPPQQQPIVPQLQQQQQQQQSQQYQSSNQQQHQQNPHQQHGSSYESRKSTQTYRDQQQQQQQHQQQQQSRRKYDSYHSHGSNSSSSNNNNDTSASNQQQQQQQQPPQQQTTKTMSWTNSSQHKKSTNTVAVTATPPPSSSGHAGTGGNYNKQSSSSTNSGGSSSSHGHATRTYTNQQHHNYQQQQQQNYHYQQPQTRNYGAMKMPSSPVASAPTSITTEPRKISQSSEVVSKTQNHQQQQASTTSTASTTAAPHQFPAQQSTSSDNSPTPTTTEAKTTSTKQQHPAGFANKKHSSNTAGTPTATAGSSSSTNSAEAVTTPAINLAPPASTATPAAPSTPSWASLFAGNASASAALTGGPTASTAASAAVATPSTAAPQNVLPSSTSTATNYAKKPIAKVAPYEGITPVTPTAPLVTPGNMSYSAASAQNLPTPSQTAAPLSTGNKKDLQLQMQRNSLANLDEFSLKFADFLTKYKSDWTTISLRPRGLTNRSNYCYINSILQALLGCSPLYNLIRSIPKQAANLCEVKTPTINAMITFMSNFSNLPSGLRLRNTKPGKGANKDDLGGDLQCDPAFEPTEIYKLWNDSREEHVEGRQEDAEEFLSYILNKLNDEMLEVIKLIAKPSPAQNGQTEQLEEEGDVWQMICNNRNKGSVTRQTDFGCTPLSDIFRGELRSRLQREGEHSTDVIQPFFTLQLNIEKSASVKEALEILVGRDQLEGVTGSKSKQEVVAWQQMNLEKLPPILILHLKWFDYRSDGCTKIIKKVEFPVELKIDAKILASKKYSQKQRAYRLFAVVYHDGKEATKGHYITDVYHTGYGSWLRYDDSSVKPVSENHVLLPRTPRVPYLLCYRRCDTITQQQQTPSNNQATSSTGNNNSSGNTTSSGK